MKKVIIAVILLVMALTMISAYGEARVNNWRIELDQNGNQVYYVTYMTELGSVKEFQVTETEFKLAVMKSVELENAEKESEKKKTTKRTLIADVAAWLSFWNPND